VWFLEHQVHVTAIWLHTRQMLLLLSHWALR